MGCNNSKHNENDDTSKLRKKKSGRKSKSRRSHNPASVENPLGRRADCSNDEDESSNDGRKQSQSGSSGLRSEDNRLLGDELSSSGSQKGLQSGGKPSGSERSTEQEEDEDLAHPEESEGELGDSAISAMTGRSVVTASSSTNNNNSNTSQQQQFALFPVADIPQGKGLQRQPSVAMETSLMSGSVKELAASLSARPAHQNSSLSHSISRQIAANRSSKDWVKMGIRLKNGRTADILALVSGTGGTQQKKGGGGRTPNSSSAAPSEPSTPSDGSRLSPPHVLQQQQQHPSVSSSAQSNNNNNNASNTNNNNQNKDSNNHSSHSLIPPPPLHGGALAAMNVSTSNLSTTTSNGSLHHSVTSGATNPGVTHLVQVDRQKCFLKALEVDLTNGTAWYDLGQTIKKGQKLTVPRRLLLGLPAPSDSVYLPAGSGPTARTGSGTSKSSSTRSSVSASMSPGGVPLHRGRTPTRRQPANRATIMSGGNTASGGSHIVNDTGDSVVASLQNSTRRQTLDSMIPPPAAAEAVASKQPIELNSSVLHSEGDLTSQKPMVLDVAPLLALPPQGRGGSATSLTTPTSVTENSSPIVPPSASFSSATQQSSTGNENTTLLSSSSPNHLSHLQAAAAAGLREVYEPFELTDDTFDIDEGYCYAKAALLEGTGDAKKQLWKCWYNAALCMPTVAASVKTEPEVVKSDNNRSGGEILVHAAGIKKRHLFLKETHQSLDEQLLGDAAAKKKMSKKKQEMDAIVEDHDNESSFSVDLSLPPLNNAAKMIRVSRLEALSQTLRLNPEHSASWYLLGLAIAEDDIWYVSPDEAHTKASALVQSLSLSRDFAPAWYALAVHQDASEEPPMIEEKSFNRIACLVNAITHDPFHIRSWKYLSIQIAAADKRNGGGKKARVTIRGEKYTAQQCKERAAALEASSQLEEHNN